MRLAIMQPYFFPYVGYFSLLANVDRFVVFDPVQYIRHGWINRNRILNPGMCQPLYITVPLVKHSRDTRIRDIRIASDQGWKERIIGQIKHYKKHAPYFNEVLSILEQSFCLATENIVELNMHCLDIVRRFLGIDVDVIRYGEIASQIEPARKPGEWALNIAAAVGATAYVNPIGGKEIFDADQFRSHGIELVFIENHLTRYSQVGPGFVPGLSVLDALMFNGVEATCKLVDDFRIVQASPCRVS